MSRPTLAAELAKYHEIDAHVAAIARSIRVLSHLKWPEETKLRFLERWRTGRPELPRVELGPVAHDEQVEALESAMSRCDRVHPLGNHLYKTAWSYATAARMLAAIGKPEFTEHSVALYGRPDRVYERQGLSVLDAANPIMDVTSQLVTSDEVRRVVADVPAEAFAARLQAALDPFFTDDRVDVVIDGAMSAKAAAGSRAVKLRAGALFSRHDFDQLLNHEALIHTATLLNGKRQPLRTLGLGSPRTTRTQEGIAVFSELVTFSIDLARLRRVALRAQAVNAALEGGDFLDVYRLYLDAGQTEEESYHSAQRVFRGGDVRGSIAFTKDGVYLEGLLLVQTFLRKAISDRRPGLISDLFAGRLTLGDVLELQELFDAGVLVRARYVPPWAAGLEQLSAHLAYSLFSAMIRLEVVDLDRFRELDEEFSG